MFRKIFIPLLATTCFLVACPDTSTTENENEPNGVNNTFPTATPINLGEAKTDRIDPQTDVDIFKVVITQRGTLTLTITNYRVFGNIYNKGENVTSENIIATTTPNPAANTSTTSVTVEPGTYYAYLGSSTSDVAYSIKLTFTETPPGTPTITSFSVSPESGDAPLAVTFSWQISDPEDDLLTCRLDVDSDGTVDYTIANCTSASTQNHIYAVNGEYVARLSVSDGTNTAILNAKKVTVFKGSSSCNVAQNDTFAQACTLSLDTPVQETIESNNDKDYYKITVGEAGVLDMKLDPVPSSVAMEIVLYDKDQNQLAYVDYGNRGQARFLEYLVDEGTYYIGLFGSGQGSSEKYTFEVSFDTTDPNELNNTFSDATVLTLVSNAVRTQGTIRSAGDRDYFKVTVTEPGVLVMDLDPVPPAVSMAIYLYNQDQNRLDYVYYGNRGNHAHWNTR